MKLFRVLPLRLALLALILALQAALPVAGQVLSQEGLPMQPMGKWATITPAPGDYAGGLSAQHRQSLADFRQAHPSVDPTGYQAFHAAILAERQQFGDVLEEDEAARFTTWLERMEPMQAALVLARARHIGIAAAGRDRAGRSFTLLGFDGTIPLYSFARNAAAAESTGVNLVSMNAGYDPPLGDTVSGAGLYVNVNDHGTIHDENPEFQLPSNSGTRIVYKEIYDAGDRSHMTHVTGTVGAWGYNSAVMGMVPRVWIRSHIQQSTSDITGHGMLYPGQLNGTSNPLTAEPELKSVMGTTSLGWDLSNHYNCIYTSVAAAFDSTLRDFPHYIHFYAASNNGSAYLTLGNDWPMAKNLVTVGSVSDTTRDDNGNYVSGGSVSGFSARGPTFDGRIKPDLTANGDGLLSPNSATGNGTKSGTSMATPNASGSATLLISYIASRFPGHFFRSSTIKALLINTTTDRGTAGPDYNYGWGIMNIKAAADIIKRYAEDPASRVVLEDQVGAGEIWTATYTYDGSGPARVTLCWIDPPGIAQTYPTTDRSPRLVNDLDLRLVAQDGTTFYPFVMPFTTGNATYPAYDANLYGVASTTGDNFTDNVEQVLITAPPAGTYTVQVSPSGALSGGSQRFSLAVSGMAQTAPVAPVVAAVAPAIGDGSDNFQLTISGSGFLLGSDILLRRAGSPDAAAYGEIIIDDQIQCRIDTSALAKGYWDAVLRAPDGSETVLPNAFLLPVADGSGARESIYANDFEGGAAGLSLGTGWALADPDKGALGGPANAQQGLLALVTYPGANYTNDLTTHATLPAISTVGFSDVQLQFQRWIGLEKYRNSFDYGRVQYSLDGVSWTSGDLDVVTNLIETGWSLRTVMLPPAAEGQASVYLRFALETDASNVSFGWSIDDLVVSGIPSLRLPPVFTSTPPETAAAGEFYSYTVATSDADTPGEALVLAADGLPAGLAFTPDGVGGGAIAGTPAAAGTASILISVADGDYTTYQVYNLDIQPAAGFGAWISAYPAVGALAGELDDPEGDGILNVIEYALGGDPTLIDAGILPAVSQTTVAGDNYLTLVVTRNSSATGVTYTVEVGSDLAGWSSGPEFITVVSETPDMLVVRDNTPLAPGTARFIRLSVGL